MDKRKRKLPGPLAKPMRPLAKGLINSIQNNPDNSYNAKLKLLCEYYDIKPDRSQYSELALSLAIDFIPGFKEKKKTGAKNKWTEWSGAWRGPPP